MLTFKKLALLTGISAAVLFTSCNKDDDNNTVSATGNMSGDQEVPVKTTGASGTYTASYNKDSKVLTYTINWSALTGTPTGAHIHGPAARGVNAGIKHDFFSAIPKTASGTYSGSVTVDNSTIKEDSLLKGFYYLNMHTPTNPAGEIRGQIELK